MPRRVLKKVEKNSDTLVVFEFGTEGPGDSPAVESLDSSTHLVYFRVGEKVYRCSLDLEDEQRQISSRMGWRTFFPLDYFVAVRGQESERYRRHVLYYDRTINQDRPLANLYLPTIFGKELNTVKDCKRYNGRVLKVPGQWRQVWAEEVQGLERERVLGLLYRELYYPRPCTVAKQYRLF